ncbi:DUF790 family protein [Nitrosopumilus sp.]|uniref:DUF790 family protein n=1 Tax=Nitrosopumilus sp. TaxID=2024843 RepID=UPI003B5A91A4
MLPHDLLRTQISQGKIKPLFCSPQNKNSNEHNLAANLVGTFEDILTTKKPKRILLDHIHQLDSQYDYKLVRGLSLLLERRSIFESVDISVEPMSIRQQLFEESSTVGIALDETKREEIIEKIASQNNLSVESVQEIMWADLEENLILVKFDSVLPEELLMLYNLSLAQTLLFKCTSLEFFVQGGYYWKNTLRNVKRFGLMYTLEEKNYDEDSESITCSLEGPVSLFKMTERYGTSMAKLLPWIIQATDWKIRGSIVRKNESGSKIYPFSMSKKESEAIFGDFSTVFDDSKLNPKDDLFVFDSSLEAKFEKLFLQYFNEQDDWKISREPNPVVAGNGRALIPDFVFEKFGRRVYFEIVGFWTKEYLERKTAKVKSVFAKNQNKNEQGIDLLVAVNSDLACSQLLSLSSEHVFSFKKEVPIKPIAQYLRKIDEQIIQEKTNETTIKLDKNSEIISIREVAKKHNIPFEATLKIILSDFPEHILVGNSFLVSQSITNQIKQKLSDISKFNDACKILEKYDIPEACHADLISKMGYDVVWVDLNPDNATIIQSEN